jgi:4-amino-4-deoxy-L-arabinose transferase-like glycosyltransferase
MLVPGVWASLRGWHGARAPLASWRTLLGPAAFVAAAALWLVPMVTAALASPDPAYHAYLDNILFKQTAQRYAQSWDHPQPPWYQLEVMLTVWLPAMLALPWAIPAWRRRLRRRDARYLLPLAWWLMIVVFFSIPSGKRDVYILPALPMACLALAPLLPGIVRRRGAQRLALGFTLFVSLLVLSAGAGMLLGEPRFEQKLVSERGIDAQLLQAGAWMLAGIGCWGLGCALWLGRRRAAVGVVAMLAGLWVTYGVVGYTLLNDSSSSRGLMRDVGARIGPDAQLGLVAWREQNLLMADRRAATFGFSRPPAEQMRSGIAWQQLEPSLRWLLVQETALPDCVERERAQPLDSANRRDWWLLPASATASCM